MRVQSGVVQFSSGGYAAVVFGEGETEEETAVIGEINWGNKRIVGDYCASCGSRVLFIYPCQEELDAQQWTEGAAAQILNVVDIEIRMRELKEIPHDTS